MLILQEIIDSLTHIVHELNERLTSMGSRRGVDSKHERDDIHTSITSHKMRITIERLLRQVSAFNGLLVDLEASEATTGETLIRSSVLMHGLSSELHLRNREVSRMAETLRDQETMLKLESRKLAKSATLRQQMAINVTNSICAGYLNIQMGDASPTAQGEKRFVCLNFADLRIYDYTLSSITNRLLVAEHNIEVSKRASGIEYFWKHKSNDMWVSILLPVTISRFSKWAYAMDMVQRSLSSPENQVGPAVSIAYPGVSIADIDEDSTIVDTMAAIM
jgi:hypothetical protein